MKRKVASFYKKRVVVFEKRASSAVNIEVKLKHIRLVLPEGLSYRKVFSRHRRWLVEKLVMINEAEKLSKSLKFFTKTERDFKILARSRVAHFSSFLNVPVRKICFRYMKTKWGSWSSKGSLTLNLFLRFLPRKAVDYVIVHELTHYFEPEHNERFYRILESCLPDFKDFEKLLFAYWIKLDVEGFVERFMKKNQKFDF